MSKKPELIAPAGNWSCLKSAIDAGADGVYFGVKGVNMRNLANNFHEQEIAKVMDTLKAHGKKGYLTLNTIMMNSDLEKIKRILIVAKEEQVNAVILWDMAVLSLAKEIGVPFHISTQASISNRQALKVYAQLGAKRVVLARECSLQDIGDLVQFIYEENLNCEIETFIHGAMCISVSGRCFLSEFSFGKSANKGECLQPCRREYEIVEEQDGLRYTIGKDYILSPQDLCSIEFVDQLIEKGIHTFKIEGRNRNSEYVRVVVECYREAIEAYYQGELDDQRKSELKKKLSTVYNRGFSTGFYFKRPNDKRKGNVGTQSEKKYIGEVIKYYNKIQVAEVVIQCDSIEKGQKLLIVGAHTPAQFFCVDQMQVKSAFIEKGEKGQCIGIKVPFRVRPRDKVFLWREW